MQNKFFKLALLLACFLIVNQFQIDLYAMENLKLYHKRKFENIFTEHKRLSNEIFKAIEENNSNSLHESLSKIKKDSRILPEINNIFTPLTYAVSLGNLEVVKDLINCQSVKVNIDEPIYENYTPLMLAAKSGFYEIAEFLVSSGANLDLQNIGGRTAIMLAAREGHEKIVELLFHAGASLDILDNDDNSLLMFTVNKCSINIVKLLLTNKTQLNKVNRFGDTCLISAMERGSLETIKYIIRLCPNNKITNQSNKIGNTPILLAALYKRFDVIDLLVSYGASKSVSNKFNLSLQDFLEFLW